MLRPRFIAMACLAGMVGLGAACSVYDEGLLGAGGEPDDTSSTRSSASSDGGGTGDGGTGPGSPVTSTSTDATTSTTTSTASSGVTGTVTTGGGCQTAEDCPGEDTDCAVRSCDDAACSVIHLEQGVVVARQTDGDCLRLLCDGAGGIETVANDADLPEDDGNQCTVSVCASGVPDHDDVPEGQDCSQDGGAFCDGAGTCVECLSDDDCPENCSDANTCVEAACDDNARNGMETDADCGGPDCDPCVNGDTCAVDGDCISGDCATTCQPSCTDTVASPGETDVDCGGVCTRDCLLGQVCAIDTDCDSDQCLATVCRPRIFFSEYVEGSSNNKAVEIFNYGNVAIDLAAATCSVRIYANGGPDASVIIGLEGSLQPLEVHVLTETSGDPQLPFPIEAFADQKSGNLNFNGDDAVTLECMGVIIDAVGQIGVDPGSQWGSGLVSTADNTLRRKDVLVEGDPNAADSFDPAVDWDGFAQDTFAGLGSFP